MFTVEGIKSQIVNHLFDVWYSSAIYRAPNAPGMGAVMRQRHAVGLPWRRGDQWGATHATFAGQEQAAAAFERTARPAPRERRRVRKRSVVLKQPPMRERRRRGAQKITRAYVNASANRPTKLRRTACAHPPDNSRNRSGRPHRAGVVASRGGDGHSGHESRKDIN